MKKYEENYGDLLEKKSYKEADKLRIEMLCLKQKITEMEFFMCLDFEDEISLEILSSKK